MRIGAAPAAAMQGMLEELEDEHGSVHAYLAEVGVIDLDLERARRRLVG
jgi:hypothetical protein